METLDLVPIPRWLLFITVSALVVAAGGLALPRRRARQRRGLDPATFERLRKLEVETRTMMDRRKP